MIGRPIARRHVGVDERTNRVVPGRNLLVGVSAVLFVSLVMQVDFVRQILFVLATTQPGIGTSYWALALRTTALASARLLAIATTTTSATAATTRALSAFFAALGDVGSINNFLCNFVFERVVVELVTHFDMVEPLIAELTAARTLAARRPFTRAALARGLAFLTATTSTTTPTPTTSGLFTLHALLALARFADALVLSQTQVRRFLDRVVDVVVLIQFQIAATLTGDQRFLLVALAPRGPRSRFAEGWTRTLAITFATSCPIAVTLAAAATLASFSTLPTRPAFATFTAVAAFLARTTLFAWSSLVSFARSTFTALATLGPTTTFAPFAPLTARRPIASAETFFASTAFAASAFTTTFGPLGLRRSQVAAETPEAARGRRLTHVLAHGFAIRLALGGFVLRSLEALGRRRRFGSRFFFRFRFGSGRQAEQPGDLAPVARGPRLRLRSGGGWLGTLRRHRRNAADRRRRWARTMFRLRRRLRGSGRRLVPLIQGGRFRLMRFAGGLFAFLARYMGSRFVGRRRPADTDGFEQRIPVISLLWFRHTSMTGRFAGVVGARRRQRWPRSPAAKVSIDSLSTCG